MTTTKKKMAAKPELPEGCPLDSGGLQVGDRVQLLRLEEWFFNGILAEDAALLKGCVGLVAELIGFSDHGRAELEFMRGAPGRDFCSHTIWGDPSWLEKV